MAVYSVVCKVCKTKFNATSHSSTLCSDVCKKEQKRINNVNKYRRDNVPEDANDSITCKVCNVAFKSLGGHLLAEHKMTSEEYMQKFNTTVIVSANYAAGAAERVTGDKNPGYQHGGALSAWSLKSKHHSPVEITAAKQKAKDNRTPDKRPICKEYWMAKGFTEAQSIIKVSERQTTFSLDICIEKHGEEAGKKVFNERQAKWLATLNSKTDEELAIINEKKAWSGGATSNVEKRLQQDIVSNIPLTETNVQVYKNINVDIRYKTKIIELFGDYWHMDPRKYESDYFNKSTHLHASEKWEKDRLRIEMITCMGYDVKVVWECDYIADPIGTLNECMEFLLE